MCSRAYISLSILTEPSSLDKMLFFALLKGQQMTCASSKFANLDAYHIYDAAMIHFIFSLWQTN